MAKANIGHLRKRAYSDFLLYYNVVLVVEAPSFGEEVDDEIKCWLIISRVLDKLNVTSVIINQIAVTDSQEDW